MNREEIQREIIGMENEIKELKKRYKRFMKLNKGNMNDEIKIKAKSVKKYIKESEKELRKARIQFYAYF